MARIDADEKIAEDGFTRHQVLPLLVATAETLAGLGSQVLGPIRERLVATHATQRGPGGYGQNGGESVTPPCGATPAGYIGFIENLGNGDSPKWAKPVYLEADGKTILIQAGENGSIQGPAERKWGYTTLSVVDWDGSYNFV